MVGWEKHKHNKVTKKTEDSWEPRDTLKKGGGGGGGEQEEDTLNDGFTLLGEGDSVFLPSKALNKSSFNDTFQYA